MYPTLLVEASDGTERARITADTARATRVRRKLDRCEVTVPTAEWLSVDVDARTDRLTVLRPDDSTLFGGRLDDSQRDAGSVTVTLVSYERDAKDAEPTSANQTYQNTADSTIVTDGISAVPTLTAGTIETLASSLSYSFANAARSKQIRDPSQATGGSIRYNADRTVDYQQRFGTDRSEVLSPASQHVVGEPSVTRDARDEVTHVRAFGGGQGPNQLTSTAVASSYQSGERQVWREFEDPNIKEQDRLDAIASRLASEYDGTPRKLTVDTTIVALEVTRGDTYPVQLPERGVDARLEAVRVTEAFAQSGRVFNVTLTSRTADEDTESSQRELTQEFGRGYRGFVDRAQAGGDSRQPVTPSLNSNATVTYPDDVVVEETARVLVEGLPYRAYSSGAENNPPFSVTTTTNVDGGFTTVDGDDTWTTVASVDPNPGSETQMLHCYLFLQQNSATFSGPLDMPVRLAFDFGTEGYWPDPQGSPLPTMPVGTALNRPETITTFDPSLAGDYGSLAQIELQTKLDFVASDNVEVSAQMRLAFDDVHTHPPNAGVTETFGGTTYYPSNCDVLVNGTSMGVSLGDGSGTFQEFVDISGELDPGANTVEVTSDSLGHIRSTVETELFRRGRST